MRRRRLGRGGTGQREARSRREPGVESQTARVSQGRRLRPQRGVSLQAGLVVSLDGNQHTARPLGARLVEDVHRLGGLHARSRVGPLTGRKGPLALPVEVLEPTVQPGPVDLKERVAVPAA